MLEYLIIHWDEQDPNDAGWAYRSITDGVEETGPYDDIPPDATGQQLADAVVLLAWHFDVDITSDEVTVDMATDGGYAFWQRNAE